jgi:phosphatidylserine/phosphatidylglycerophosphate/cardiolipin synthase-like enzyme
MSLLIPGDTCWRTERADRAAVLVDTEAYFAALTAALPKARRSILILGWGFDPRARLEPDGTDGPADKDEIGRVLLRLAHARPELDIRLLIWRSAFPVAASQEFFPHKARRWFKGSPIRFRLDDQVPLGACHHQKAVIIDDRLAFCGGGDISVDRWDTPGHLEDDRRRIMPDQECHAPRHEVMMMVDGDAARTLGDLFRDRWRLGTKGEVMAPPPDVGGDPWPDQIPPQYEHVDISLARTLPAWRGRPCVQELHNLALASIASARDTIYMENQYFTSPVMTEALARRLQEPEGPQVVLVTTGGSPSWFDQMTMDHARGAMVWRLRAADTYGRFRAFCPVTSGGSNIIVHSKTTVIDDTLVRVGSANLNNRSFGFDTELELALACETPQARIQAAALRDRLVGHFMGYTGETVAKARADHGGLVEAIDALNRDGRLAPIDLTRGSTLQEWMARYHIGDPADVSDAWRIGRRRRRLLAQTRAVYADEVISKSITSGR